jgi:hypothetical protein
MDQLTQLMKEFNKAGKKITIQISTVDEEHSEMYNDMRKENGLSPVESVESYPTILSEQTNGSSNQTNANKVSQDELIETVNSATTSMGSPMNMAPGSPMSMATESVASLPESNPGPMNASPIAPPTIQADEIVVANNGNPKPLNQMGGYGLYPAIASTAYHLAPAGILLAAAAATFKCRKGKKRNTRRRR